MLEKRLERFLRLYGKNPEIGGQELECLRLERPEEGVFLPDDTEELADQAEKELDDRGGSGTLPVYSTHLAVRSLGEDARNKKEEGTADQRALSSLRAAKYLLGTDEAVCVRVQSADEEGNLSLQWIVSAQTVSKETVDGILSSAFGQAQTVRVKKLREFPRKFYARGKFILQDKKQLTEKKEEKKMETWAAAVLRSLPADRNFTAEVHFQPMGQEERKALEVHIRRLEKLYDELKFRASANWSNSMALGSGNNPDKDIMKRTGETVFGTERISSSRSYTLTLGSTLTKKRALTLTEELEYELLRLKTALHSTAWSISICVTAGNDDTVNAVASVLTGALTDLNIGLGWTTVPGPALIAGTQEAAPLAMFPTIEFGGFAFVHNEQFLLCSPEKEADAFPVGRVLWNQSPVSHFYLSPGAFGRHAFICGMTGSGKTNTLFQILGGTDVPFLVIEPVKGEYRALQNKYEDLTVWSMRPSERLRPGVQVFRFNPFWFPPEADLIFHIDSLKTIISSAFELSAAMPNIIEQCLYHIYIKSGWNIAAGRNIYRDVLPEEYLYPTFSDLCSEVEAYLDKSEFGEEVMDNYRGALLTRLKSFVHGAKGILLNTSEHPDYRRMMNGCSVIELEGLADDSDKCLVMGAVLVQYYEYVKYHFQSMPGGKLQHLIVIEEAHRLFKNTSGKQTGSDGVISADPVGQLVEMLGNIMAEIRAFGEGMLIVDQSPTRVAEEVIKNSAIKIVHRIDNGRDVKMLQSAMLMQNDETSIPSLKQGEALIRTDGMTRPCKVKMALASVKENYQLSDTFHGEGKIDQALQDAFAVAAVLYNEDAYADICRLIERCRTSLMLSGLHDWYGIMECFLRKTVSVLDRYQLYDLLEYRFRAVRELVSMVIRRMYGTQSRKSMGMLHMSILRLIDFYREKRDGFPVKEKEIGLLREFIRKRVTEQALLEHDRSNNQCFYYRFCDRIHMESTDPWAMELHRFARRLQDEEDMFPLADMTEAEQLYRNFIITETFLDESAYEASCMELFERLWSVLREDCAF